MNDTAKTGASRPKFKRSRGLSDVMLNEVYNLVQHRAFVDAHGRDGRTVEEGTLLAVDAALGLLGYGTELSDEIRRLLGLPVDGE